MTTEIESIHAIKKRNEKRIKRLEQQDIRPFYEQTMREKYLDKGIEKIAELDIESSGLTADFDITLSYCIGIRDVMTDEIELRGGLVNQNDFNLARRKGNADLIDKRIIESLLNDLSECQYAVGHWFVGKHRHDIPFIRTRAAMNDLLDKLPPYKTLRYGDTQKWYSQGFQLHSYGLASIADMLGILEKKTPVPPRTWKAACIGNKKALEYVYDHNVHDVKIQARVHKAIERFVPISGVYF